MRPAAQRHTGGRCKREAGTGISHRPLGPPETRGFRSRVQCADRGQAAVRVRRTRCHRTVAVDGRALIARHHVARCPSGCRAFFCTYYYPKRSVNPPGCVSSMSFPDGPDNFAAPKIGPGVISLLKTLSKISAFTLRVLDVSPS